MELKILSVMETEAALKDAAISLGYHWVADLSENQRDLVIKQQQAKLTHQQDVEWLEAGNFNFKNPNRWLIISLQDWQEFKEGKE
jgi:hypothetical protein